MQDSESTRPGTNPLRRVDPNNQLSRITYEAVGGPYKKRPRKITKPSYGEQSGHSSSAGCPCWLLTLLVVLALIGLAMLMLMGIGYYKKRMAAVGDGHPTAQRPQGNQGAQGNVETGLGGHRTNITVPKKPLICDPGFFKMNGKCLKCPVGSNWNGTNCVRKVMIRTQTEVSHQLLESSGPQVDSHNGQSESRVQQQSVPEK